MLTTYESDYIVDHFFCSPFAWSRSRKGNKWRRCGGYVVTVFLRDGWFYWCVKDGRKVIFGERAYKRETAAMAALEKELKKRLNGRTV